MSEARIRSACDLLSSKSGQISSPLTKLPTSQSSQHSGPLSTKNTYSTNQIDIIDLTVDDDDDDEDENVQGQVGMGSTTQTKTEPNEEPRLSTGGGAQPLSLAYHANNHTCAGLRALLETLSAKETQELARDVKVYKPGMKVRSLLPCTFHIMFIRPQSADLISGLLRNSNKQTTLNFKGKTPINYKDRITSMVIEKLGAHTTAPSSTRSSNQRQDIALFSTNWSCRFSVASTSYTSEALSMIHSYSSLLS